MQTHTIIDLLVACAAFGGLALSVYNAVQHFLEKIPRVKVRAWKSAPRKVSRTRTGRDLWVDVRNVGHVPVGLVSVGWFDPKVRHNGGFVEFKVLNKLLEPGASVRFIAVKGAKEIPARLLQDGVLEIHTGKRFLILDGEELPTAGETEQDAVDPPAEDGRPDQ